MCANNPAGGCTTHSALAAHAVDWSAVDWSATSRSALHAAAYTLGQGASDLWEALFAAPHEVDGLLHPADRCACKIEVYWVC